VFVSSKLDVLAGLKSRLIDDSARIPGSRLLEGRFTAVQQAMGAPKPRAAASAYLAAFVEEIKRSGLLASLIEKHHASGLSIARD
jgi:polar amino acid transport system substrate-binding protein